MNDRRANDAEVGRQTGNAAISIYNCLFISGALVMSEPRRTVYGGIPAPPAHLPPEYIRNLIETGHIALEMWKIFESLQAVMPPPPGQETLGWEKNKAAYRTHQKESISADPGAVLATIERAKAPDAGREEALALHTSLNPLWIEIWNALWNKSDRAWLDPYGFVAQHGVDALCLAMLPAMTNTVALYERGISYHFSQPHLQDTEREKRRQDLMGVYRTQLGSASAHRAYFAREVSVRGLGRAASAVAARREKVEILESQLERVKAAKTQPIGFRKVLLGEPACQEVKLGHEVGSAVILSKQVIEQEAQIEEERRQKTAITETLKEKEVKFESDMDVLKIRTERLKRRLGKRKDALAAEKELSNQLRREIGSLTAESRILRQSMEVSAEDLERIRVEVEEKERAYSKEIGMLREEAEKLHNTYEKRFAEMAAELRDARSTIYQQQATITKLTSTAETARVKAAELRGEKKALARELAEQRKDFVSSPFRAGTSVSPLGW